MDKIEIGGLQFGWELEKGRFTYENEDAVLFWISSAMREFFDTIEEISGEEVSNLVFETTGYRQGVVVGNYFQNKPDVGLQKAAELITNTYASAGWGRTKITNLDPEKRTLTAELIDSWEHKINVAQGKTAGGLFLPAHYAGIFSGMFGTNIWYKVERYQLEGHESTIIHYFPSEITVAENIHQLARKKESQQIMELEAIVEDKTRELKNLVRDLSSPIIPVLDHVVVVPLIGKYDEERSEELLFKTLENLPAYKARYLLLDLTGLDKDIGQYTANLISKVGSAASMIGTKTLLVGISPDLGLKISNSGISLASFDCFQTLQHGIHYALGQMGKQII
ncbi:Anti-anti-sigma regulatory factor (antagonist of anti-sigma factor) [Terribacillus halophilus]|uniref:Anti-anti-sigma regulatory factor (Antagonist of anti-sigma factor) n=1 Tax=Terribacillus halophilus TaxID=361279 RepID=A0A1G6WCX0_9BACI|nr:STAS domain-containing protein [Terribacillus halophilus]SDD63701.1 Anti-anti-sigma regulatory factor (antagonist of anti-sigma factor) [Terribacillus halophilus]